MDTQQVGLCTTVVTRPGSGLLCNNGLFSWARRTTNYHKILFPVPIARYSTSVVASVDTSTARGRQTAEPCRGRAPEDLRQGLEATRGVSGGDAQSRSLAIANQEHSKALPTDVRTSAAFHTLSPAPPVPSHAPRPGLCGPECGLHDDRRRPIVLSLAVLDDGESKPVSTHTWRFS